MDKLFKKRRLGSFNFGETGLVTFHLNRTFGLGFGTSIDSDICHDDDHHKICSFLEFKIYILNLLIGGHFAITKWKDYRDE